MTVPLRRFPDPTPQANRVPILGVGISTATFVETLDKIESWIRSKSSHYVCITGAHGIIESRTDHSLRGILNRAGLATPDGMPLVFMAHQLGFKNVERVYGPDLMLALSERSAQRGYKQFYYGGDEGVADRLATVLCTRFPGLKVVGTCCPPFRDLSPKEDDAVVTLINATKADILWIGLSTPKQERWMASHLHQLNVPVLIGVGAAFDFIAGTKPQAPRWMQERSLEWLHRLYSEPRRLWRRYAQVVPLFLFFGGVQLIKHRLARADRRPCPQTPAPRHPERLTNS